MKLTNDLPVVRAYGPSTRKKVTLPVRSFTNRVERFCRLLAEINRQAGDACL